MEKMPWDGPKWGREDFFPTNPDLAHILGRTDLDFEILIFFLFVGPQISGFPGPQISKFLDFQVPRSPNSQISKFSDFQVPRFPDAAGAASIFSMDRKQSNKY